MNNDTSLQYPIHTLVLFKMMKRKQVESENKLQMTLISIRITKQHTFFEIKIYC